MSDKAYVTEIPGQVDMMPGSPDPISGGEPTARTARLARGTLALSNQERAQRQDALSCSAPGKEESMTGCTQTLHYTVFFDGTGNNRDEDRATGAMSNVAKLAEAHKKRAGNIFHDYIPGVGTPFPEIGDKGGLLGMGLGARADDRIEFALKQLDLLIDRYPSAVNILLINITAFGFSRGAAQTRAFIRDLVEKCTAADGGYTYRGKPIRVAFLGLFDTVCSAWATPVGAAISANGGHNGWADGMHLPSIVEQSVHMTAAHEARRLFPLDSIRDGARYPDNTVEIWYPGVHSDVGGGYAPDHQGRDNTISRFALNEMYDIAFAAGVLFQKLDELIPEVRKEFTKDDPELQEVYNAYLKAVPKKQGRLEDVQAGHMELLHRWLKFRLENETVTESMQRLQASRKNQEAELKALVAERRKLEWKLRPSEPYPALRDPVDETALARLRAEESAVRDKLAATRKQIKQLQNEDKQLDANIERLQSKREQGQALTMAEETMLRAWDNPEPLPDPVRKFFDRFSHDSIAHFGILGGNLTDWRTIYFGDTKYKPS